MLKSSLQLADQLFSSLWNTGRNHMCTKVHWVESNVTELGPSEQRWCSDVVSRNLVTLLGRRSSLQPHRLCVCAQRLTAASTCDKYGTKRVKLKLETSTSTNNDHHVNCSTLLRKWKKDSHSNVCDRQFITDLCASCVFKQLHWSQKYTGHKVKKGRKKVNKLDQHTHTRSIENVHHKPCS